MNEKAETGGLNKASTAVRFVFESVFWAKSGVIKGQVGVTGVAPFSHDIRLLLYLRSDFKYQIQIILTNG